MNRSKIVRNFIKQIFSHLDIIVILIIIAMTIIMIYTGLIISSPLGVHPI